MRKLLLALVLFVAALLCSQLDASPAYPNCVAGTLQSYIDSSGCLLGESSGASPVYSGFALPFNPDGTLDASQIEVTPVSSGLNGNFDFSGDFSAPAGDTVTYDIDYFLLLNPGAILGGESLFLDPSGNVSVTESICPDSFFGTGSGGATVCETNTPGGVVDFAPLSLSVNDGSPPNSLAASITLNPVAYNFASVEIAIVLTGGATGATSGGVIVGDTVEALSNDPPAPEPGTSLFCLAGLAAIGIFRGSVTRRTGPRSSLISAGRHNDALA